MEFGEPPSLVFKYFPPERLEFLKNRLVRFTQPAELNDIFEITSGVNRFLGAKFSDILEEKFVSEIGNEDRIYGHLSKHGMVPKLMDPQVAKATIREALARIYFNDGFVRVEIKKLLDPLVAQFNDFDIFRDFSDDCGVFSLSSDALNPVMWYHYAKMYSGYVVGFDTFHPWFWRENEFGKSVCQLFEVTYENTIRSEFQDLLEDPIVPFLRKRLDWAYEKEWRMVKDLKQASAVVGNKVKLFEVPAEAVTGIYFGPRTEANSPLFARAATFKVLQNPEIEIGFVQPKASSVKK